MLGGIMGLEVGLPPDATPDLVYQMTRATLGELPVILRVNLDVSMDIVHAIIDAGVSTISLGAPRGTSLDIDGNLVTGRLYGPGVFPLALKAVEKFSGFSITLIGSGGLYQASQVDAMLKAGASAVQVGAATWKGGIIPNVEF